MDENLHVGLVIFYGLPDEFGIKARGKLICILFDHIHDIESIWLGQKIARFRILISINQQVKGPR
jgi:hypothetical protein